MEILIACSPSTGSSLLRRILNRHSQIFCGPETSILAKPKLYQNWKKFKYDLLKPASLGLMSGGWHHVTGVQLGEYEFNHENLKQLVENSESFKVFIDRFFKLALERERKQIWAEKTPSNAFCVDAFYDLYPDSRLIHIVRSPYDTIASLVTRGISPYNACVTYLMNTCAVINANHPNKFTIKYEDLVKRTQENMSLLMDYLGLPFEPDILNPQTKEGGVNKMKGWAYAETEKIGDKSVNKFQTLDKEKQESILSFTNALKLKDHYGSCVSISDVCNELGYNILNGTYSSSKVKSVIWIYKLKRTFSRSNYSFSNYPIEIDA